MITILSKWINTIVNEVLPEKQAGYGSGLGTRKQMHNLKLIIKITWKLIKPLFCVYGL